MPLLTISDAARLCGVDRRTLQRAIQAGRLTLTPEHRLDTADLRRAGYAVPVSQLDPAPTPQGMPRETPHVEPQEAPQELPLVTALLAHLEQLTRTIVALHEEVILLREDLRQTPQRRRIVTPPEARHAADTPQGDAVPLPQDAAPMPHHDTLTPPDTPQAPAPDEGALGLLPPYLLAIAAVAAEDDTRTLGQLAQLLYDRGLYRARDRKTGEEKPVNRGTLARWLQQARQAGVLERSVTSASPHD
jgi:hypothetical protein